jgi:N-acetyl-anhydromuramyl-L-alanine amidase AmpD
MEAEYPGAIWAPSPNFNRGRGSSAVSLIVIHITDGSPNVRNTVAGFGKSENQKSAHFVVGRTGEVYQCVQLGDKAWHDSGRNGISIGIEHCARSPGELRQWAALSEHERRALLDSDAGDDLVNAPTDPGLPLTEVQLDASAQLVQWLLGKLRLDVDDVVPHCSNPGTSHKDCGKDIENGGIWPWAKYRDKITSEAK